MPKHRRFHRVWNDWSCYDVFDGDYSARGCEDVEEIIELHDLTDEEFVMLKEKSSPKVDWDEINKKVQDLKDRIEKQWTVKKQK